MDPAIKQQQQLMALQAAAAGFSNQQQHQTQHQQQAAAVAAAAAASNMPCAMDPLQHVGSYTHMVDTSSGLGGGISGMGGGMGMGMGHLQVPLGLSSSSPLSAPLPQLSHDMLAALQSMGNGAGGSVSPIGNALMHHHSGIPTSHYTDSLPGSGRLQRSLTAHPAVNAAAAAAAAADNSSNLNELSQHLALMQLMQGGPGGPDASGTLPDLSTQSVDQLLGLAQLQQHQQQHAAAAAAAAVVTAGLDLGRLLPVTSYGQAHDGSISCPLPPVYGTGPLAGGATGLQPLSSMGAVAGTSLNLPRVPTAPGRSFAPTSPCGSDTGRDAPSPVGADGRDTQVAAPGKKGHRWSAPVSPSNSSKGGNDLAASDDAKQGGMQQPSSSASSTSSAAGGSNNRLHSIPSDHMAHGLSGALNPTDISFSAGVGTGGLAHAGSGSSGDAGSALLLLGDSPLEAAQVQAVMSGHVNGAKVSQQQHSMGKEKAAQLLAQMPEDAVQKLLALMQQQGAGQ
jgi:hypothetical protein